MTVLRSTFVPIHHNNNGYRRYAMWKAMKKDCMQTPSQHLKEMIEDEMQTRLIVRWIVCSHLFSLTIDRDIVTAFHNQVSCIWRKEEPTPKCKKNSKVHAKVIGKQTPTREIAIIQVISHTRPGQKRASIRRHRAHGRTQRRTTSACDAVSPIRAQGRDWRSVADPPVFSSPLDALVAILVQPNEVLPHSLFPLLHHVSLKHILKPISQAADRGAVELVLM